MFDDLAQDLRYALRLVVRQPLLSAATIATLAFGIGLNAGVFTVLDGLLFRPRVGSEPATFVEVEAQPSPVRLQDYEAYASASTLQARRLDARARRAAPAAARHVQLLYDLRAGSAGRGARPACGRLRDARRRARRGHRRGSVARALRR